MQCRHPNLRWTDMCSINTFLSNFKLHYNNELRYMRDWIWIPFNYLNYLSPLLRRNHN